MAKIKIFVAVVQKNVVVIDADGLAETCFVAHLATYALRIGSRHKHEGGLDGRELTALFGSTFRFNVIRYDTLTTHTATCPARYTSIIFAKP